MLGVFAAFSAELCAQVVAVEPARDSAARTSSSRVDTLRDKMSDALIVRAGVIASPSERIWSAFVGMACVIPRKSRETVLLVDPEVAWGTATTYGAPSAGTRGHRGDDKPLPYIWQRYDTRSGQGSAPQLVHSLRPSPGISSGFPDCVSSCRSSLGASRLSISRLETAEYSRSRRSSITANESCQRRSISRLPGRLSVRRRCASHRTFPQTWGRDHSTALRACVGRAGCPAGRAGGRVVSR